MSNKLAFIVYAFTDLTIKSFYRLYRARNLWHSFTTPFAYLQGLIIILLEVRNVEN